MIGVIVEDQRQEVVRAFFEFFKVPWMFYRPGIAYDVVIVAAEVDELPEARLVILFDPGTNSCAKAWWQRPQRQDPPLLISDGDTVLPVFGRISVWDGLDGAILRTKEAERAVGVAHLRRNGKVIVVGYDLFEEVSHLLSRGQDPAHSMFPTLEMHAQLLRKWMVVSDIPFVEIPPSPAGHAFIVCLTHDVDFVGIRNHRMDRTVVGYVGRVLRFSYSRDVQGQLSWERIKRNWVSLATLPAVYLGLAPDFWCDFDRYLQIEQGRGSTFYFVPYPEVPGGGRDGVPRARAVKYDVRQCSSLVKKLAERGCEIGLHGLDAWHDARKGKAELAVIQGISGLAANGVRMHWLYFSDDSPRALAGAGFRYDSSMGYNEAVGFRCGTSQAFPLPGCPELYELPLHIMDTALFSKGRMNLSEGEAMKRCQEVIGNVKRVGGVLTVNWHTRSLSPERNWDGFYNALLEALSRENPWFATGSEAVTWFQKRRSAKFKDVSFTGDRIVVHVESEQEDRVPPLLLRVYPPRRRGAGSIGASELSCSPIQAAFSGSSRMALSLLD